MDSINAFFKKLKPEQRQKLLLTFVGALAAIGVIYYTLIRSQLAQLSKEKEATAQYEGKVAEAERLLKMADTYRREFEETGAKLKAIEDTMAPPNSDLYAWMFKLVKKYQEGQKVAVLHVSSELPCEVGVFPQFPYQAIPASIDGQGSYHDIGKFVADFENQFPYFRVQNLELKPLGGAPGAEEKDLLSFKLEIVALIAKSAGSK